MTWTEKLGIDKHVDLKSLIFGSAIATTFVIIGMRGGQFEYAYPLTSIGFLYVGYKSNNRKMAALLGAIAAIPIAILAQYGGFGTVPDAQGLIMIAAIVMIVGLFVSVVGHRVKTDREKAKVEYEKQQKKGKNKKNKNKNKK